MEVTVTIKLEDGTTRTIELQNANINTVWGQGLPANENPAESQLVLTGHVTVIGQIKNAFLIGSI